MRWLITLTPFLWKWTIAKFCILLLWLKLLKSDSNLKWDWVRSSIIYEATANPG